MFVDRAFSGCVGQDAGMSLQGSFDVLGFSEVLELLERKRQSGRLHVRAGGVAGHIYLRDGHLTGAESGDYTTPASAGEARTRLEELCFEFLQCERGVFEFQPRVAAPWPTQLSSSVETVLREARQRLVEWREIQAVIPSMEGRPRVVDELVPEGVSRVRRAEPKRFQLPGPDRFSTGCRAVPWRTWGAEAGASRRSASGPPSPICRSRCDARPRRISGGRVRRSFGARPRTVGR